LSDEIEEESQPTLEEKLDIILARQDELAQELLKEGALDLELKRLIKVVLYLFILALVFYIIKSLLTPILSYI
jgi:hypothetical protein